MAYSILGVKKLQTFEKIKEAGRHNERTRNTPNADPARQELNERLRGSGDLVADVQGRLDAASITQVRKNGVRAVEHMLTASPEWFGQASPEDIRRWVDAGMAWLQDRYGDNLVAAWLHRDETSPQIHAVIVPINDKGRLSADSLFGQPHQLRTLHTEYNNAVKHLGLDRGVEHSKARHVDVRQWYHQMGRPTMKAWELARQIEIAPPQEATRQVVEAFEGVHARAQYWEERARQLEGQVRGYRQQEYSRETQEGGRQRFLHFWAISHK